MADVNALANEVYGTPAAPGGSANGLAQELWGGSPPAGPPAPAPAASPMGTPGVQPARWRVTIAAGDGAPLDALEVPGQWQDAVDAVTQLKGQYRPGTRFDIGPVPTEPASYQPPPSDPRLASRTPPPGDLPLQESFNPVEAVLMGGGITAGATLGALRGPVSRVVGAGMGGLVTNRVNKGIGYTPGGAFGPVDAGDVLSTVLPMGVEGGTLAATKWQNARQGLTAEPGDRALVDLANAHGIDEGLTYGDVQGVARNPAVARQQVNLERTTRGIETRQAGQAETRAAAENVREHYGRQVAGDYEGMPEVQAAAAAGNREARYTLDLVKRTDDANPGAVVQASAKVRLVNQKLQAGALYAERDRLAAGLGTQLEPQETLRRAYAAMDAVQRSTLNLDPSGGTQRQLDRILTRLEPTSSPNPQLPGVLPAVQTPARISYQDLTTLRHELDLAIHKTSATPYEQELLGDVRDGIEQDLKQVALDSGKPNLIAAQERADRFYPGVVSQREFVKQIEDLPPDQVVPALIKRGQGDRAQGAFDALDAKGQAAVRVDMLDRALYDGNAPAIHPGTGHFSPARFAKNLEDQRASTGVFFPTTGEGAWELQGFTTLMRHLERNGAYIENPPTGQRLLDYFDAGSVGESVAGAWAGYAAGGTKGAVGGATLPMARAALKGLSNWALMTPRGRDFMLAASDLEPGSRALQSLLAGAAKDVPALQPFVGSALDLPQPGEPRR